MIDFALERKGEPSSLAQLEVSSLEKRGSTSSMGGGHGAHHQFIEQLGEGFAEFDLQMQWLLERNNDRR
ncbi:MAG TPA: hypothetical protein VGI47_02330 [Candidatus Binataceae bacterium]|jgi:hypothetical protein